MNAWRSPAAGKFDAFASTAQRALSCRRTAPVRQIHSSPLRLAPRNPSTSVCLPTRTLCANEIKAFKSHNLHRTATRVPAQAFSTTRSRLKAKTIQQAEQRQRSGPLSWKSGLLFVLTGVVLTLYFRAEKSRLQRKRVAEANKGVGRPRVGGPFELVDQEGKKFTSEDMKGKFALVYFGFTHCPDICPEELDKMVEMVRQTKEACGNIVRPVFISCDPARDTPQVVKAYLDDFSPEIVGLTGTYDAIKQTCKEYRVYFSTPPDVKPGQDYLVDHSIYFYLMDPEGDFVEALGRHLTPADCTRIIAGHLKDWNGRLDRS